MRAGLLVALLLASLAQAGEVTVQGQAGATVTDWTLTLPSYVAQDAVSLPLTLTVRDWDTAGEATVSINGNPLPGVLTTNITANNNRDVAVVLQVPRALWDSGLNPVINRVTFGWPRDVLAGRQPGWSYQVLGMSLTYTDGPPPPPVCVRRVTYFQPTADFYTGQWYYGCQWSDTLERETYRFDIPTALRPLVQSLWRAMLVNDPVEPFEPPTWGVRVTDACSIARLWAKDDQGLSRAATIERACTVTP